MEKENTVNPQMPPVAVIGMGCTFPKASGLKDYWRLLSRGQDAIEEVPDTHWSPEDYYDKDPKRMDYLYCTRGGFISPVNFDPTEFGIPPNILEATDTSQLLGLLAAKAAMEDAGYGGDKEFAARERTSVILGVTGTQELVIPLGARLGHPIWRHAMEDAGLDDETVEDVLERIAEGYVPWQESSFPGLLGNVVAGRITNRLNLGGTNCVVDAACASSMSAIHTALLELYTGRSDMAVSGGADCLNDIFMHMCFTRTPILSPTGDIRPFAKNADGTLLGEGIGMLVLKRLADAERDNDRIYAVIRGMGTSSDGKSNSIYAPLAAGQLRALKGAYENAGIDPKTVGLIEAHGTGTRVGDAVEFGALNDLMGKPENGNRNSCAVGTVKSMIGHTKAAAGAAGLIKTVLSLHHKVLPPTLKIDDPDPRLELKDSRLYLNTEPRPWISDKGPRRAGVSSFGFGGSNFHLALEEYKHSKSDVSWDGSVEILAISSDTREGIIEKLNALEADFKEADAYEIAAKAAESRAEFSSKAPHRFLLVLEKEKDRFENPLKTVEDALNAFEVKNDKAGNVFFGGPEEPGKLAFVFPGQGSQYVDMGSDLACRFPEAQEVLQQANAASEGLSGLIYPPSAFTPEDKAEQESRLRSTDAAQPAIGAASVMMLKILKRFGVDPDAVCGHSFGELTALHSAGWIDAPTFFQLAVTRGALMAEAGGENAGTMSAVKAPLEDIDRLIKEKNLKVVLANRNSPDQGVISGSVEAIEEAEAACKAAEMRFRRLPVSAAFHSELMKEAGEQFAEVVQKIKMTLSDIPVFSNMTGEAYPDTEEAAKNLLAEHLLSPVDFVGEVKNLLNLGVRTFVEIGPKSVLTGLIRAILAGVNIGAASLDSSAGRRFGMADLARLLCYIAATGHPVDLKNWEEPLAPRRKQKMSVTLSGANYRSPYKKKAKKEKKAEEAVPDAKRGTPDTQSQTQAAPQTQLKRTPAQTPGNPGIQTAAPSPYTAQSAQPQGAAKPAPVQTAKNSVPRPAQMAPAPARSDSPKPVSPAPQPVRALNTNTREAGRKNIMTTPKDQTGFSGLANTAPAASGHVVADAFRTVQQGLYSMQSLQTQTAETHQKFLEAQSQASRTLQEMLASTRHLAEVSMGVQPALQYQAPPAQVALLAIPEAAPAPVQAPAPAPVQQAPAAPPAPVYQEAAVQAAPAPQIQTPPPVQTPPAPVAVKAPAPQPQQPAPQVQVETPAPSGNGTGKVEAAMLEVVSELTGYPEEMLSLDMDIEADLGIDSIKRVEILSTFEEKMPGFPAVSPEVMGTLKTLGQVVEYLTGNQIKEDAPKAAPEPVAVAPSTPTAASGGGNKADVEAAMLVVVSDLTGYPEEMLSMDMDIEADLGIDSIKRVEILSSFEEKMPGLPAVSPEVMGTLKTLGQVVDYLTQDSGETAQEAPKSAAPAPEAAPAAPAAQPAASADGNRGEIESVMLKVVSDLTGYPEEMLSMDMDIEADLGIDSIKRVEILSSFEEKMPSLPSVSPDMMGTLKTLGQIADYLAGAGGDGGGSPDAQEKKNPESELNPPEIVPGGVKKKIIRLAQQQRNERKPVKIPGGRPVFITEDGGGLARAIADELSKKGAGAVLAKPAALIQRQDISFAGGLIILADAWENAGGDFLKESFALAKAFGPALMESAKKGGAVFSTVSRMDGGFGFKNGNFPNAFHGGLAGLVKTASIEWEGVNCRALDIDAAWTNIPAIAQAAAPEFIHIGPVETGLGENERLLPRLETEEYPTPEKIDLNPGDVVVISGGARGVTAETAFALAEQTRPVLVLMGRSPLPAEEPSWLKGLTEAPAMKKAILTNEFGGKATPVQLEKSFKKYLAGREIHNNIARLESTGAKVLYYSVDVRDAGAVGAALNDVRAAHGPVKALIHGAGTLADRFIIDKTPEQFEMVFDTKISGLNALLSATASDPLNYLIFFSSVAARMGNKGQVDYAMANEVLNKTAQIEAGKRENCRVISFNWGPWDGGMVTPELSREFARNNIELIP